MEKLSLQTHASQQTQAPLVRVDRNTAADKHNGKLLKRKTFSSEHGHVTKKARPN